MKRQAYLDSEQMWRLETQKRSLSTITSSRTPEQEQQDLFTFTESSPTKVLRIQPLTTTGDDTIICREPPICNRTPSRFHDLETYENHHKQYHELVCLECKLHFPTERILALHIEERHDPFVEVQRAKQTYKV